jgi:hypothetical protein
MVTRRSVSIAVAAAAALLLAAACGSDEPEPEVDAVWEQSIAFVRELAEAAEADFVLSVIEDGEITAAEMQEAWTRTNACFAAIDAPPGALASAGLLSREEAALIGVMASPWWMTHFAVRLPDDSAFEDPEWMAIQERLMDERMACDRAYNGWIVDTFMRRQEADVIEARPDRAVECLIREGLVTENFTVADLRAVQEELAPPETCAQAEADLRFLTVVCNDDGTFSTTPDPDWTFVSRAFPGAPDLIRDHDAFVCVAFPD